MFAKIVVADEIGNEEGNGRKLNRRKACSWKDGWMGGGKSRLKDCLQQPKTSPIPL